MKGVGGGEDGGVRGQEILNKRGNNPPTMVITNTRGVAYAAEPCP